MVSVERKVKQGVRNFHASLGTLMRGRLVSERQLRAKKIKTIKATVKAIDAALHRPGSKPALRQLRAVRTQITKLLEQEVGDLTKRIDASKGLLARLRGQRTFPSVKP